MQNYLSRILSAIVSAIGFLLAGISGTQAAVYVGAWDPLFGAPYSASIASGDPLSFSVSAKVTVPDSCVVANGTVAWSCGGGSTFNYVDVTLTSANGATTYSTLSFASALTALGADLVFSGGLLTGVHTGTTNLALNGGLPAPNGNDTFDMFFNGDPYLIAHHVVCTTEDCWESFIQECISVNYTAPTEANPYTKTGWTLVAGATVPEPGSAALLGSALFGMAWALRRRRLPRPA